MDNKSTLAGIFGAALCIVKGRSLSTTYNRRYLHNALMYSFKALFGYYFFNQLAFNFMEPAFIRTDTTLETLSDKYQFTVFDFAQSKKESHLKEMRN
jgi:hypothetical protein